MRNMVLCKAGGGSEKLHQKSNDTAQRWFNLSDRTGELGVRFSQMGGREMVEGGGGWW